MKEIPESTKFAQTNRIGIFPGPLSLSLGPYGFLLNYLVYK